MADDARWKPPVERPLRGVKRTPRFHDGERVRVLVDCEGREVNAVGAVVRLRRSDDAAWIELERRCTNERVHPFPANHPNATHVLAWSGDCERLD